MNQNFPALSPKDCFIIQLEILVEESWIDQFLAEQQIDIPVNDNIHLTNLKINLDSGMLNILGDIREKEGSSIEIISRPAWDSVRQVLCIEELKLQTKSNNLFLKGASWFAQHFLNSKLDKKIEDQANLLYSRQLEKLKTNPIKIPIPKTGRATMEVANITIDELVFIEHAIMVKATIEACWKLRLTVSES